MVGTLADFTHIACLLGRICHGQYVLVVGCVGTTLLQLELQPNCNMTQFPYQTEQCKCDTVTMTVMECACTTTITQVHAKVMMVVDTVWVSWLTIKRVAAEQEGLSMLVAAGPFTSKDDALYEPLQAVLDHCSERPPHVLLLLGPFVDVEHPSIQAGTIQDSFDDIFATQVHALLTTNILLCKL